MIYLKRLIFTMILLFLFLGYAAQNTMNSDPRAVNDKQQLIFQVLGNKLIINKADIEKIELQLKEDEKTPSIEIQLDDVASKKFHDFTGGYIGQRMQIVWNGTILSDTVIMSALPGNMVLSFDVDSSVVQEMVSSLR